MNDTSESLRTAVEGYQTVNHPWWVTLWPLLFHLVGEMHRLELHMRLRALLELRSRFVHDIINKRRARRIEFHEGYLDGR